MMALTSKAHIPLGMSRLDTTWLDTFDVLSPEPMHFGCVELVEQHGSTQLTRRARPNLRDLQLSLLFNL